MRTQARRASFYLATRPARRRARRRPRRGRGHPVVMITGDHPKTAAAVAAALGIACDGAVLTGSRIGSDALSVHVG